MEAEKNVCLNLTRLAVILAMLSACASLSAGQKNRPDQLRVVEFSRVSMAAILAQFAKDYQITIGFEVDPKQPESKIELHLRDVNFNGILDGIIRAEPRYQWREQDGSIEVWPVNGELSLLDTPIDSFQVKEVSSVQAVSRLLGLSEVRTQMMSMNLQSRPLTLTERTKDEKLSFDLKNVTLRQALNRIAQETDSKFWVFRRHSDGTFEIRMSCC